ncbi:MAG: 50S ribosomal protein L9 [Candidatus Kapaibacterium sp.]
MKIILRQDIDNLGKMGEVVDVKNGYARNYLIPREMAYVASPGAMNRIEAEKKVYLKQLAKEKVHAEELAEQLSDQQVSIAMKVGEEGRLYGSVTPQMIGQELQLRGYDIERRDIMIEDPIKTLGVFDVKIRLHPEVVAPLKVWVISEE